MEGLRLEVEVPVAQLVLDRPERLNALTPPMLEAIVEAAAELDRRHDVRAVVVRGEGRAFCAGFDVDAFDDVPAGSWADRDRSAQLGLRMADAVEGIRAMTIAALHGHVVGGGLVIAAACDLRVAAAGTTFAIPEVDLGIPLAWGGIPRLVRELGPAMTKEIVATCRPFGAEEAQSRGFLNRVVPDAAEAREEAVRLAEAVAARPEVPVTWTKRAVNAVVRHASAAGFSHADGAALLAALSDPEARERRRAYLRRLR